MSGHQSSFRRIGRQVQRAMDPDSHYLRSREHSRAEIQTFLARLANTGVDIGGGPYPVRRSVAFRGPEHPIEGPWRNGMLLGEPRPWPVVYQEPAHNQANTTAHRQSSYSRRYREQTLSREHSQWREQQAQESHLRRYYGHDSEAARRWNQYVERERQFTAYRISAATANTTARATNSGSEWDYDAPRPGRRVTCSRPVDYENARAESEEDSEETLRGVNHTTPDTLSPPNPEDDPDYDQEYVTMSGRRIPSRREQDARRKDPYPDQLNRIYMHEPDFTGRLVMKFMVAFFASLAMAAPAPGPTDYEVVVVPHGNPVEIDVPGYVINVNK
ncbi:hypothetical protein PWT90_07495 [Aphanocladium album]|nr:hypothetical protein PWT90_07495 [Aphanocladium album]